MMNKSVVSFWLASLALAYGGDRKVSLFTAIDLGRVEAGYDLETKYDPSGTALNRTYVDLGFVEQLDEHNLISIGVGGIFWKSFEGTGGNADDKSIKFGPGISNAFMKWSPNDRLNLTFGYFPYKYNQAAKNLGEYLFRTEAYPTIIYTGGWSWLNDVQYKAVGAKLTHTAGDGYFTQDLGLFGEYFNSPIYDITPAYVATLRPMKGLTLGGGASLHRFITPTPKTRKTIRESHVYYKDFYLPAVPEDTAMGIKGKPAEVRSILKSDIDLRIGEAGSDSATYYDDPRNAGKLPQSVSFDLAAVKALAFFEVDFNAMLDFDAGRLGLFNLYGEVAQLGFKNYPIFYTESAQRRPIMLGFSVPTFGLLSNLSFETEILKNPIIESVKSTYDKLELTPAAAFRYDNVTSDDVKWSVHASRSLTRFFSIYFQVANDHMRLKNGFAQPNYVPLTHETGHWYWLTRLQWMI